MINHAPKRGFMARGFTVSWLFICDFLLKLPVFGDGSSMNKNQVESTRRFLEHVEI